VPERVSIIEDQNMIKVDSFGEIKIEDLRNSMYEVAKIHREQGLKKVFVDATKETSFPTVAPTFGFGSELAESMINLRIAVVTPPKLKNILRFLETVATNRGAQVQLFDSEVEALAWLDEEP
jgi:hypothetical protein